MLPVLALSFALFYDPSFSPREVAIMQAEVADWRRVVPALHVTETVATCPEFGDSFLAKVCVVDALRAIITGITGDPNVVAFTFPSDGVDPASIYIDMSSRDTRPGTFAHELGHAMGLPHDKHHGTLMSPYQYCGTFRTVCDSPKPTFRDVVAWYEIRLRG